MSITYESIIMLRDDEAAEPIRILRERGDQAALEHLKSWHEPGEGTLISTRSNPWKEQDHVFQDGNYVLYCDFDEPYIGLVCTVEAD